MQTETAAAVELAAVVAMQERADRLRREVEDLRKTGEERAAAQADPKTRRRVALYLAATIEGYNSRAERAARALDRSRPNWFAVSYFVNPHTGEPLQQVEAYRARLRNGRQARQN